MTTHTEQPDCRATVEAVAESYGRSPDFLIPMLQDLQRDLGYLPLEAMKAVAEILQVPLSQCYAVATFYKSFSLTPRGAHQITLCTGTVCYLKGAREISAHIQDLLGVPPGGTTEDLVFTFQPVNCLGACALAPVMVVDDQYFEKVKLRQVSDILATFRK